MQQQQQQAIQRVRNIVPSLFSNDNGINQLQRVNTSGGADVLSEIKEAPLDPILGTKILHDRDPNPSKINLGIGAYRTDDGKPYILKCVREAEKILAADKNLDHEYLAIEGHPGFRQLSAHVLFGKDSAVVREERVANVQSLSGTGALRIGGEFIHHFFPKRTVYVSNPTWGNHNSVFAMSHVAVKSYRYWNNAGRNLDIEGMLADIRNAPAGSVILLHACAHNPTGVDPTEAQWKMIADVVKQCNHVPFFDIAYQGFATGDLERDASALRYFVNQGFDCLFVAQSYAKNVGLYGERAGTFSVVCPSKQAAQRVLSQLKIIIRSNYSNPPAYGARIVHTILSKPELYQLWLSEMREMAGRIAKCRQLLLDELKALGTPGDWTHVVSQIGMFSYTGLTVAQCKEMIKTHHVYLLENGRISMAGVNTKNVKHLARAIDDVVRRC